MLASAFWRERRSVFVSTLLVVSAAALAGWTVLGSVGGDGSPRTAEPSSSIPAPRARSLAPLERDAIARATAAQTIAPGAVRAVLVFWRDLQYANDHGAYTALNSRLRRAIAYERFVEVLASSRWLFNTPPVVEDVERRGEEAVVFLRHNPFVGQDESRVAFTLVPEDGQWTIVSDPYALFGLAPPAGES